MRFPHRASLAPPVMTAGRGEVRSRAMSARITVAIAAFLSVFLFMPAANSDTFPVRDGVSNSPTSSKSFGQSQRKWLSLSRYSPSYSAQSVFSMSASETWCNPETATAEQPAQCQTVALLARLRDMLLILSLVLAGSIGAVLGFLLIRL